MGTLELVVKATTRKRDKVRTMSVRRRCAPPALGVLMSDAGSMKNAAVSPGSARGGTSNQESIPESARSPTIRRGRKSCGRRNRLAERKGLSVRMLGISMVVGVLADIGGRRASGVCGV